MKFFKVSLILFFLFSVIGCVTTRVISYETTYRDPKPFDFPIDIYESNNLTKAYKTIGIVKANAGKLHSSQDTINRLKILARQMGGDALLDLGIEAHDGRVIQRTSYGYIGYSPRQIWFAKVITWEKNE